MVLAAVVGVMAATSTSLLAGAQRSSTVVDRFLAAAPRYDLLVSTPGLDRNDVRTLPGVARADPATYVAFGHPVAGGFAGVNAVTTDFSIRNPDIRVLSGAWPAADDPTQIVVNERYVAAAGGKPGDSVTMATFGRDQLDDVGRGVYEPHGPSYTFTIAAVVRLPDDNILQGLKTPKAHSVYDAATILVPDRFWEDHHDEFLDFGAAFDVVLRGGMGDAPAFLDALATKMGIATGDVLSEPVTDGDSRAQLAAPVRVETTALLAIGIGAAVATMAGLTVLLLLERRRLEPDTVVLRRTGFTSRQLAIVGALRIAPATLLAAIIAVSGSVLASGWFPIGIGRRLELDEGLRFTPLAACGGLAVIVATLLLTTVVSFERPSRRTASVSTRAVTSAPLPISLGLHLATATSRSRRRAVTIAGLGTVAIAIAAGVVIAVWVTGVDRLNDDPARHGFEWSLAIGNVNFRMDPDHVAQIEHDPRVAAATAATFGQVAINGSQVELLAFDPNGTAPPAVVAGRLPETATEIALGPEVMRQLDVDIGDTVTMSVAGTELAGDDTSARDIVLRVVGEGVAPPFGESDMANTGLLPLPALEASGGNTSTAYVLVDVSEAGRHAAIEGLARDYTDEMATDVVPGRVMNLARVRDVPLAGLAVVAVLGVAIMVASLAAAGRRNRRTLAVLRSLGLDAATRQWALLWQGVFAGATVVLIGIPLGLIAGSIVWGQTIANLGTQPGMPLPSNLLAFGAVTTLVTAVATAVIAGNRTHGAALTSQLRAE